MATELDIAKTAILRRLLKINSDLVRAGVSGEVQALVEHCLTEMDRLAVPARKSDELARDAERAAEGWLKAFSDHFPDLTDEIRNDLGNAAGMLERTMREAVRAAQWRHLAHAARIEQLEARVRDLTEAADGG